MRLTGKSSVKRLSVLVLILLLLIASGMPASVIRSPLFLLVFLFCLLVIVLVYSIAGTGKIEKTKTRIKLANLLTRNLQGGITALSLCLLVALLSHSYLNYQSNIKELRKNFVEQKKELLVTIINQAMERIAFERANSNADKVTLIDNLKKQLSSISYADGAGYIFVVDFKGVTLVSRPAPHLIGKNVYDLTDPNGLKLIQELIKAGRKPGGGFVRYIWNKPGIEKPVDKISYSRAYHEWNWILGTGVYLDDIEALVSKQKAVLKKLLIINALIIAGLGLAALGGMAVISRLLSNTMSRELAQLISGIDATSGNRDDLNPDNFSIDEFSHIAQGAAAAFSTVAQLEVNLRNFFDTIDDFLFVLDYFGTIIQVNKTAVNRLGYSYLEMAGQPFYIVHPASYKNELDRIISDIPTSEDGYSQIPLVCKDGTIINVETRIRKGEWNGKRVLFGVSTDVTELKKSEERLASVIHGTNIGTWEWNVQTGETILNDRWAGIVGYTLEELSPVSIQTWMDLAHPEDLEQSDIRLNDHFNGKKEVYDFECRMKHKDGYWIWVHDCGRLITRTEDGKPLMMSGTHTEITDRKLAEEKQKTTLAETSRLNRLMVGREERVVEMKKEVNSLLKELGQDTRYRSVET